MSDLEEVYVEEETVKSFLYKLTGALTIFAVMFGIAVLVSSCDPLFTVTIFKAEHAVSEKREPGKHGWRTIHLPKDERDHYSIGVFQWVRDTSGNTKPGEELIVLVHGDCSIAQRMNKKVAHIIKQLDAGTYEGPANVILTPLPNF